MPGLLMLYFPLWTAFMFNPFGTVPTKQSKVQKTDSDAAE